MQVPMSHAMSFYSVLFRHFNMLAHKFNLLSSLISWQPQFGNKLSKLKQRRKNIHLNVDYIYFWMKIID